MLLYVGLAFFTDTTMCSSLGKALNLLALSRSEFVACSSYIAFEDYETSHCCEINVQNPRKKRSSASDDAGKPSDPAI